MSETKPEIRPIGPPQLACYALEPDPPILAPGRGERDWMNQTDQRYAYRCLPLSMANASGWEILCPTSFTAVWLGGPAKESVRITEAADRARANRFVSSHFGHGVLTFHTGYLFRTNPGWALWCRGAPNSSKRRLVPLEGLVETDWLPLPFTMNWRFTRIGSARFEEGEPFCFITPAPHALLDEIQPTLAKLDDNPALKAQYAAWSESRAGFNEKLAQHEPQAVAEGWQRTYMQGRAEEGGSLFHRSKRRLKAPR